METQLYDLYMQAYAKSEPNVSSELLAQYGIPEHYWRIGGHWDLSLPKEVAFVIARAIDKKGGVALVYPKQYRHPRVSHEQSQQIVLEYYQELVEAEPDRFGKIKEMEFNPIWYNYVADDYVKQEQDWVPGFRGLQVDKLTGRVLTDEEYNAFYRLLFARKEVADQPSIHPR